MKRKTQEDFIKECTIRHKSYYSYEHTIYTKGSDKITITCPCHGDFEQRANSHLAGSGCKECLKLSKNQFIEKCNKVHKSFYDYTNIKYRGLVELITISCKLHGNFTVKAHSHLYLKTGCPLCSREKPKHYDTATFITKANKVHNFRYDYSQTIYTGSRNTVLIKCQKGHLFEQKANDHLNGSGCTVCTGRFKLSFKEFEDLANTKHNNYYTYSKQIFTKRSDTIEIECPVHGTFKQTVRNHLRGHGCIKCSYKNSGWTKTTFRTKCLKNNNEKGFLYVLKCFNEDEIFYKIGITSRSVSERFNYTKRMPYNYEVIHLIEDVCDNIYDLEVFLQRVYKCYHYIPQIPFGGSLTECFKILP